MGPVRNLHELSYYENLLDGDYAIYVLQNKKGKGGNIEYEYGYVLITTPSKLNLSWTYREPLSNEEETDE